MGENAGLRFLKITGDRQGWCPATILGSSFCPAYAAKDKEEILWTLSKDYFIF